MNFDVSPKEPQTWFVECERGGYRLQTHGSFQGRSVRRVVISVIVSKLTAP